MMIQPTDMDPVISLPCGGANLIRFLLSGIIQPQQRSLRCWISLGRCDIMYIIIANHDAVIELALVLVVGRSRSYVLVLIIWFHFKSSSSL